MATLFIAITRLEAYVYEMSYCNNTLNIIKNRVALFSTFEWF